MASLFVPQLLIAMALTIVVQAVQIGAYAARLAGVISGRIATSISLFNLFVTASRLASLIVTPALGALADAAAHTALDAHRLHVAAPVLHHVELQLRLIVLAGTLGTTIGALLLPTFIMLFLRGIGSFERTGSVLRALVRLTDWRVVGSIAASVRPPPAGIHRRFSTSNVPAKLMISNVIVTAIYAIGVTAAYYASDINLIARTTATGLSGLINGFATITFTLIVDPTSAYITDQAARGERSLDEVKSLVFYLSLTAIVGTLLSQLILTPAAYAIAAASSLFYHPH